MASAITHAQGDAVFIRDLFYDYATISTSTSPGRWAIACLKTCAGPSKRRAPAGTLRRRWTSGCGTGLVAEHFRGLFD